MSEISESLGSILPLELVDENGDVAEAIFCDSISGGAQEICGMPKALSLAKLKDGKVVRARYIFQRIERDIVNDSDRSDHI